MCEYLDLSDCNNYEEEFDFSDLFPTYDLKLNESEIQDLKRLIISDNEDNIGIVYQIVKGRLFDNYGDIIMGLSFLVCDDDFSDYFIFTEQLDSIKIFADPICPYYGISTERKPNKTPSKVLAFYNENLFGGFLHYYKIQFSGYWQEFDKDAAGMQLNPPNHVFEFKVF